MGSCEHGNEPSGSIKCWEVLEWLSDWRLLKKDSAPWNYLVVNNPAYMYTDLPCVLHDLPIRCLLQYSSEPCVFPSKVKLSLCIT
jgi:hypothetical protein